FYIFDFNFLFRMLVDVHAHLDHIRFEADLDKVIERCRKNKVTVISAGVNKESNRIVLEIASKYKDVVKASLGMYPFDAIGITRDDNYSGKKSEKFNIDEELEFIKKNKDKIVGISEVGLDKSIEKHQIEKQKKVFLKVIELSEKIKKPLIVHSRKAELECVELLESCRHKNIVMHFFSGNMRLIKRIEDNGWSFSIPCIIDRLQHFQLISERVNINQLLSETDSPYASSLKKERNEPSFVKNVVKIISDIKKLEEEEVRKNIFMNFQKLFLKN
ncbi:MAG: TatD family hydrolase, partial [Nanoarchaeota archaeon]